MKTRNVLALLAMITLTFGSTYGQENLIQRTLGGSKTDNSYAIEPTVDGGYVAVGYTESFGKGGKDMFMIKFDGMGQVEWGNAYGEKGDETAWNVDVTRDSGFIVVGNTNSYNSATNGDAIIFKTDDAGKVEWARTIASDSVEDGYNVLASFFTDGYYVTGYVRNDSTGDDGFIAKLGSSGNIRWYKKFGSPGNEEAYGLAEDRHGNVVICGMTTYDSITNGGLSGSSGSSDAFLAKFDSTGGFKWMKTFGSNKDDVAWDVKSINNKYVVTGFTKAVSTGDQDMMFIETDTNGNNASGLAIGSTGDDRGFEITAAPGSSGGYVISGYAEPQPGDRQVILAEISSSGLLGNTTVYGGTDRDGHWPTSIAATADGGFMIFSTARSFNSNGDDDLYLLKVRGDGTANCNSSVEPINGVNFTPASKSFGSITESTATQTPTVSVTQITTGSDTTLCCQLSAALPRDSVEVCEGLPVTIGTRAIRGLKYSWTDESGKEISTISNPQVRPSKTTTYKVVISSDEDNACGSDSATIKVVVNTLLTGDWTRDTSFCDGDSVTIVGSASLVAYNWVGNTVNSNSRNIKLKQTDTIVFTGIDVNSCSYKDTMIATKNALPSFSLGSDTTICEVEPITLVGPSNMSKYDWNNGDGSSQNYTTGVEKTHTLVVTDANGCSFEDNIAIFTNPSSPFSLGADDTFCMGESFTILGPGALTGYIWNDTASSLQNLRVTAAGTYHLTAFNSFGCPSRDTINIAERALPMFDLGQDQNLCEGTTITLRGPANMKRYFWNIGTVIDSLVVNARGLYTLEVEDQFGCEYLDSIRVTEVDNPVITLGNDTTICWGDALTLTPGSGFASYNWSTNETTESISVTDEDTYSVTVTDDNGCEGSTSIAVDTMDCNGSVLRMALSSFEYYPVPASDVLNLRFDSRDNDDLVIRLLDIRGVEYRIIEKRIVSGNNLITLDLDGLSTGQYIVQLHNSKGVAAFSVIVE